VPNDTKKHVISAIKGILDTLGHDITIKVIYTDDYMKNHLVLMKLFKKWRLTVCISFFHHNTNQFSDSSNMSRYLLCLAVNCGYIVKKTSCL